MGPQQIVTDVPADVDLGLLKADLAGDGVAVLNPAFAGEEAALAGVVKDATAMGIENFKIVVLAHNYSPDTSLRDLGNQLARDSGGETMSVLVMSPGQVAGYSTGQLSRWQIEKGQDGYKPTGLVLSNPPAAARDFVTIAHDATFPWTGVTVGLIVITAALAGVARVVTRRRSRAVHSARVADGPNSVTADASPDPVRTVDAQ